MSLQKRGMDNRGEFNCGLILSVVFSLFAYIAKLIKNSFFINLFTDYRSIVKYAKKSKSSVVANLITRIKHTTLKLKNRCARFAEESIFMNAFDRVGKNFFTTNLRSVGIFLLSGGGLIVFACMAQHSENILTFNFSDTFVLGVGMTILSLLFLPGKNKSIANCVCESKFLSYFFERIFYVKHLEYGIKNEAHSSAAPAFILGIAFGAVSYGISPVLALFLIGITAYLYLIFTKPENGILLICMQLPLLADKLLVFLIAATVTSLIFKVMRGKRSHGITLCTGATIMLGIVLLSCTAFSFDPASALAECMPIITAAILTLAVIMTVRSSSLAGKCFRMIGLSTIISVVFGIANTALNYILGIEQLKQLTEIVTHGFSATFSNSESCAAFLIAAIPLFVVKHPVSSKIFSFPALALIIICLFACNSFYAVFALFTALVISMIIFSKKGLVTVIAAFITAGFTAVAFSHFTSNILNAIMPAFKTYAGDNFTSYSSLATFFNQYGVTGVGFGSESVAYASLGSGINASHIDRGFGVYTDITMKLGIPLVIVCACLLFVFVSKATSYALSKYKSESAKSKCAALFTSVCSIAIFSLFSDFLYDFRLLTLLFLIFGLISATADSADEDYISPDKVAEYEIM